MSNNKKMRTISAIREEILIAEKQSKIVKCIKLCREGISLLRSNQTQDLYGLKINLVRFLLMLKNDRSKGIEEAISLCNEMLEDTYLNRNPKICASLHRNIGFIYDQRIKGSKQKNLREVIKHYKEALKFFSMDKYPKDWAMLKAGLGLAYFESTDGDKRENISKAIEYYKDTLKIYTKEKYPDDYQDTIRMLNELENKLKL